MSLAPVAPDKSVSPEKAGAETPTTLLGAKSMRQYQIQDYETGGATCPKCGDEFSGRAGLSKHHNAQHGEKFKPLGACDRCGDVYTETAGNLSSGSKVYCSEKCRKAAWSEDRSGENNPLHKERAVIECDECGDVFEKPPSEDDTRFCSWDCYSSWRKGKTFWSGGGTVSDVCEWCDSEFERYPSQGTGRFCSPDCRHEWFASRTGEDHPLWEGGTDWYRKIRSAHGSTGWETQRNRHLGDECELCGASDNTLALHHIVPVLAGGTNAAYNYMTLCRGCHSTVENHTRDLPGMEPVLTEEVAE